MSLRNEMIKEVYLMLKDREINRRARTFARMALQSTYRLSITKIRHENSRNT